MTTPPASRRPVPRQGAAPAPISEPSPSTPLVQVLGLVKAEVARQGEIFGEQNHPMHGGQEPSFAVRDFADRSEAWIEINAVRVERGLVGWDGVLIEEVFEALAETDLERQVEELVQVAAVAVNAILSLRRAQ